MPCSRAAAPARPGRPQPLADPVRRPALPGPGRARRGQPRRRGRPPPPGRPARFHEFGTPYASASLALPAFRPAAQPLLSSRRWRSAPHLRLSQRRLAACPHAPFFLPGDLSFWNGFLPGVVPGVLPGFRSGCLPSLASVVADLSVVRTFLSFFPSALPLLPLYCTYRSEPHSIALPRFAPVARMRSYPRIG